MPGPRQVWLSLSVYRGVPILLSFVILEPLTTIASCASTRHDDVTLSVLLPLFVKHKEIAVSWHASKRRELWTLYSLPGS
jgi:hypothetical protein